MPRASFGAGVCPLAPRSSQWLVVCTATSDGLQQLALPSSAGAKYWPSFRPPLSCLVLWTQAAVVFIQSPPTVTRRRAGAASRASACLRVRPPPSALRHRGSRRLPGGFGHLRKRGQTPLACGTSRSLRGGANGARPPPALASQALGPSHQLCRDGAPVASSDPADSAVLPSSTGPLSGIRAGRPVSGSVVASSCTWCLLASARG